MLPDLQIAMFELMRLDNGILSSELVRRALSGRGLALGGRLGEILGA
jgi:hypothetical protein